MISGTLDLSNSIKMAMTSSEEGYLPATQRHRNAMNHLGEELGQEFVRRFAGMSTESTLLALTKFWSEGGLGLMSIRMHGGVVIEISGCYDCSAWRIGLAVSSCNFKASILRSIISGVTGSSFQFEETECCRDSGRACVFRTPP